MDLLFLTQELHRVEKGLAAPDSSASRRKVTIAEKSFFELLRSDAESAADPSLRGHGHLHAIVVADQSFRSRLHTLVQSSRFAVDLSLVVVGGQRLQADAPASRYLLHLRRALRYVVKEYRIEASERLSVWLSRLQERPTAKFLLAYDLSGLGQETAFISWEDHLHSALGSLSVRHYTTERPLLLAKNPLTSILNLLEYYLDYSGYRLLVQKSTNPLHYNYALAVPRSGQPGSPVDLLESTSAGLYSRLCEFYTDRDPDAAVLLLTSEHLFTTTARIGGLKIRSELRPKAVSGALALGDGLTFQWDLQASRIHLLDQHQMVQRTLPAPTGYHLSGGLAEGWYEMQNLLREGEALRQLRRFLYNPLLDRAANEERLLILLQALGRLFLYPDRRDLSGLFF